MAKNPLVAMEVMAQDDGDDKDGEFSYALEKSAIDHLKRNRSLRDLSFTPQQLENLLKLRVEN
jgi:hypothetical protein